MNSQKKKCFNILCDADVMNFEIAFTNSKLLFKSFLIFVNIYFFKLSLLTTDH